MLPMRRLWLYNPENDIALAFGGANFTPPRQARLLSLYGAPLMWWMGEEGDGVLVELLSDDAYRDSAMRWLEETERRFGRGPALVADVRKIAVEECVPWGWSRHAVRRFLDSGVDERALSAASGLVDCIRMLSHRRSSIAITRAVTAAVGFPSFGIPEPDLPVEAYGFAETEAFARRFPEGIYAKSPWSSSGRGVAYLRMEDFDRNRARIEGIVKAQGSVMVERAFDNIMDFAMLFRSDGVAVSHIGYSRFYNSRGTAYVGNLVAPGAEIFHEIDSMLPHGLMERLESSLPRILTQLLERPGTGMLAYSGCFGVDMMLARDSRAEGGVTLVPCVELNLRTTMGVVAHSLYRRLMASGHLDGSRWQLRMWAGAADAPPDGVSLVPPNPYFNIVLVPAL